MPSKLEEDFLGDQQKADDSCFNIYPLTINDWQTSQKIKETPFRVSSG
jgi:hypothetical protein